jgi:hypothetical protein
MPVARHGESQTAMMRASVWTFEKLLSDRELYAGSLPRLRNGFKLGGCRSEGATAVSGLWIRPPQIIAEPRRVQLNKRISFKGMKLLAVATVDHTVPINAAGDGIPSRSPDARVHHLTGGRTANHDPVKLCHTSAPALRNWVQANYRRTDSGLDNCILAHNGFPLDVLPRLVPTVASFMCLAQPKARLDRLIADMG